MTEATAPPLGVQAETQRIIASLRASIVGGETHWFLALLDAIRAWPLPEEHLGTRAYQYLIGGDAFDWLLLAERLCDEVEDLVPDDEREALLFHGRLPLEMDDDEFNRLLGAKHRAHLNFVYGVRVETALQLAVQNEVHKEWLSRVWENGHADDEVFRRIYGATRLQLIIEWQNPPDIDAPAPSDLSDRRAGARPDTEHATNQLSLSELNEFTYWLFKRRVNGGEPARVASDTRKGLAQFQRLEARRRARS